MSRFPIVPGAANSTIPAGPQALFPPPGFSVDYGHSLFPPAGITSTRSIDGSGRRSVGWGRERNSGGVGGVGVGLAGAGYLGYPGYLSYENDPEFLGATENPNDPTSSSAADNAYAAGYAAGLSSAPANAYSPAYAATQPGTTRAGEPVPSPEQEEEPAEPAARTSAPRVPARPVLTKQNVPLPDEDTVTLIFKDGRTPEHIHNYALTRTTLFVTDGRVRTIPVDQIDLAATEKLNDKAGVEFHLPSPE